MASVAQGVEAPPALRLALDDLYADYADALDEGALERWPDFFLDDCIYKVMPRENYERGLPVAVIFAESRDMLKDRVLALRQTIVHAPRLMRHVTGVPRVRAREGGTWRLTASFALFETLVDQPSQVFLVGQYHDKVAETPDGLRFAERICVYDSTIVPTSLIYPI